MKTELRKTQIILYIKNKLVQLYEDMISVKTAMVENIVAHLND